MIHWLDSCASTNAVLAAMADAGHGTVVAAREQTAGRGQRGNSWEAEPGRNLTFSILLRPEATPAARQFELSMAVALAVADAVDAMLPGGLRAAVKWPNDIYVGDRKICGILIENRLSGNRIESAIAGIGINVNQQIFRSDAPNPVSVVQLNGGMELDIDLILLDVCDRIIATVERYCTAKPHPRLPAMYMERLTRTEGEHPFADAHSDRFMAHIVSVDPDGTLHLSNGRSYLFKELRFI